MTEPIVFISHFKIKKGKLEPLKETIREGARTLETDKPRTGAFLPYVDDDGSDVSIVHVFADADAMDIHVQGADERSEAVDEFLEPAGWEIYGRPSDAVTEMMRQAAAGAGVALAIQPTYLDGFLRIASG